MDDNGVLKEGSANKAGIVFVVGYREQNLEA